MQTLTEVTEMLAELERSQGKEAVRQWIVTSGKELPEDIRDQVLFKYSSDAFIEEMQDIEVLSGIVSEGVETIAKLEADKREIEEELKKREVKDRLGMQGGGE